jgi:dolichol-phosphate mannosyltransferase
MQAAVWLVIPTYNEAENLDRIVRAAAGELARAVPEACRILIVDDNSPDGTGEVADALARDLAVVEVLHRSQKNGLGHAYLAGFARALAGGAERIIEMDADFSHDPRDLGRLLDATAAGADLALGSRYVPGGGVADWGLLRRVVSRAGCAYARRVLSLHEHDLTGGFKCFRREVLEAIELDSVRSHGYCFQIELTQRAVQRGFTVREVPIVFRNRRHGRSKMSPWIALEAIVVLPQLRFRRGFR